MSLSNTQLGKKQRKEASDIFAATIKQISYQTKQPTFVPLDPELGLVFDGPLRYLFKSRISAELITITIITDKVCSASIKMFLWSFAFLLARVYRGNF